MPASCAMVRAVAAGAATAVFASTQLSGAAVVGAAAAENNADDADDWFGQETDGERRQLSSGSNDCPCMSAAEMATAVGNSGFISISDAQAALGGASTSTSDSNVTDSNGTAVNTANKVL